MIKRDAKRFSVKIFNATSIAIAYDFSSPLLFRSTKALFSVFFNCVFTFRCSPGLSAHRARKHHVRRQYVVDVGINYHDEEDLDDEERAELKASRFNSGQVGQLLRLSTRNAVFDNALMRTWHTMSRFQRWKFNVWTLYAKLFLSRESVRMLFSSCPSFCWPDFPSVTR